MAFLLMSDMNMQHVWKIRPLSISPRSIAGVIFKTEYEKYGHDYDSEFKKEYNIHFIGK